MQFKFRDYDFEIDDVLLYEAGCGDFTNARVEKGFRHNKYRKPNLSEDKAILIEIENILTPKREAGFQVFADHRMKDILKGICDQQIIRPIDVWVIEDKESEFTHQVKDGFHRFYASVAMGFKVIPAFIVEVEPDEGPPDPMGPRDLRPKLS